MFSSNTKEMMKQTKPFWFSLTFEDFASFSTFLQLKVFLKLKFFFCVTTVLLQMNIAPFFAMLFFRITVSIIEL